jgi:hypothetical protein
MFTQNIFLSIPFWQKSAKGNNNYVPIHYSSPGPVQRKQIEILVYRQLTVFLHGTSRVIQEMQFFTITGSNPPTTCCFGLVGIGIGFDIGTGSPPPRFY